MKQNIFLKLLETMIYSLELLPNHYKIFIKTILKKKIKENANV